MLKKIRNILISGLVLASVVSTVWALDFPEPKGYVNDFAGLMSGVEVGQLESRLVEIESVSGVEIAVVTVENLQETTIEEFAVLLFEDWEIGKAKQDNGLLILVAQDEREMRLEVGYGLEPVITDGRAGRIIREWMTPAFKEEQYYQGIDAAVGQVEEYLEIGEPEVTQGLAVDDDRLGAVIFLFVALIYLTSFMGRTKGFLLGGVVGFLLGWVAGSMAGGASWLIPFFVILGLILDLIFSRNYKKLKKAGRSTGWRSSRGGFWSGGSRGGSSGGGFGGFGGGSSGGGGASGSW
ncbi:TPM domain-containing protein [Patescibacteria group bacterium]|nr:TPM domain-containing protein [Patescibacteria group bacterium]